MIDYWLDKLRLHHSMYTLYMKKVEGISLILRVKHIIVKGFNCILKSKNIKDMGPIVLIIISQ